LELHSPIPGRARSRSVSAFAQYMKDIERSTRSRSISNMPTTTYLPLAQSQDDLLSHEVRRTRRSSSILKICFSFSICLNLVSGFLWAFKSPAHSHHGQALYCSCWFLTWSTYWFTNVDPVAPAQDAVEYTTVRFHSGFGPDIPIYDQEPSAEVDAAWEGLYECEVVYRLAPFLG